MAYLVLLFTILFFFLAWRRLDWAVMILIIALPSYLIRFKALSLPLTVLEVMIWAVFLIWFFKNYGSIIENLKLKIDHSLKIENCKLKINRYPFDWEITLLLFIALTAVIVAGLTDSSFGIWKAYFFEPVLLFIVVVNVIKKSPLPPFIKGVELVLWPLAASALIVSALAIYQKFTGSLIDNPFWAALSTRRVVSFFGYPNAVGLFLGPIILVMMGWFTSVIARRFICPPSKGGLRGLNISVKLTSPTLLYKEGNKLVARNDIIAMVFIGLTIISSVLSIYFAKSKGALLGVAVGLIVFGLAAGKKIRWLTVSLLLIAVLGIVTIQPVRKMALDTAVFKTLSGQIRMAGWSDAWQMLKDGRLITGAGLANFKATVAPYHTEGIFIKDPNDPDAQRKLVFNETYRAAHWQPLEIYLYPHNIILNFWSELGLAGLLLFIWIIIKYFWLGIRVLSLRATAGSAAMTEKFLTVGLICAMVVIIVHGLVDAPYFKNDLAVMFWLLIAMMSLVNLENKYEKNIQ